MTSDQIHTAALDRWLLAQAVGWTVLILTIGSWIEVAGLQTRQFHVWGAIMLVSHVTLHRALGAGGTVADRVTIARGVLLLACSGLAWSSRGVTWLLWCGLGVALLADLADGWCARRFGATQAGAVLDMETDQSTTLCLAFLLHAVVGVGPWVYLLPGFRYCYILLLRVLRVPAFDPKPQDGDNRRARLICGLMMALLFVAVTPGLDLLVATVCAGVSVALLAYSYGSDVLFVWRRRHLERVK